MRLLHGPHFAPFGSAWFSIIISPMVSGVTRPTSRPMPSTTATAGAAFSCSVRNASYYSTKARSDETGRRAMGPDGLAPLRKSA